MSRYFSFIVLLTVIVLLGILLYRVMAGFLVPIFLAAILVVIFRPTHQWVLEKVKGRQQLAAGLTTSGILLAVLIPITLLVLLGVYEGREMITTLSSGSIVNKVDQARKSMGLEIPARETRESAEENLAELLKHPNFDPNNPFEQLYFASFENSIAKLGQEIEMPELAEITEDTMMTGETQAWQELALAIQEVRGSIDGYNDPEVAQDTKKELASQIQNSIQGFETLFEKFQTASVGGGIWGRFKLIANPSQDELHTYEDGIVSFAREQLPKIGGATTAFLGRLVLGLGIMTVALYFFLLDGPGMLETIKGLSPIDDIHEEELIQEFNRVSRAVVVATLLSAIAQGILAGFGFYFVGMDAVFLLTLLTACFALVPFAGAAAVWVPVCFWLYFVDGNMWSAIGLAAYGVLIISMADNFIKPYVLHGQSNLLPLLALLSVLGGVTALGPIGILIGPMVVAFLQTLLNILRRELLTMEEDSAGVQQNEHHKNEVSRWNSMTQS